MAAFFSQLGLHNLIFERHSSVGAPTTSARNEQGKILDSFWGTANISVTRCGYCHPKEFPLGGHSVVWMDLTYSCALGHFPHSPTRSKHDACVWTGQNSSNPIKIAILLQSGPNPFCIDSLPWSAL